MMKFDLHMHSYYSDGKLSPSDVAKLAHIAGCGCVSLTDHDTVAGVSEMTAACAEYGIRNLPGVEISTYEGTEIHILAFNPDLKNKRFCEYLEFVGQKRIERTVETVNKLKEYRIIIDMDYLKTVARHGISRSHIAEAMVLLGYEKDFKTAFDKWLTESAACYVPLAACTPAECIAEIGAASGVSVLAHPSRLKLEIGERANLVSRLAACGLGGLEAKYRKSSQENVSFFTELAKKYHLIVTCGSDFHNAQSYEILPKKLDAYSESVLMGI